MWRLSDDQRDLREEIRTIVREEIRPRVRQIDESCDYPHDLYALMAERGLLGLGFPAELGGALQHRGLLVRLRRGAGQGLGHGLADGRLREAGVAAADAGGDG